MSDAEPTLLLTRPSDTSAAFLSHVEAAAGRRVPVVISPVIEIVASGALPEIEAYQTLIMTSQHAVRRLGQAGALTAKAVACVGESTASLAKSFGGQAKALGATVDEFLGNASALSGPCLYCRGVHVSTDLAAALQAKGCVTDEAVVYSQRSRPLTNAARQILTGRQPVVLPLFSARSARLVQSATPITAPLTVIAISQAVADVWSQDGTISVAREPSAAAMVEAVIAEI